MSTRDYDSIQRKRNFIVGVFVLVAVAALIWLIIKFGELPAWASRSGFQVIVQFPDAAGIQQNTPVRLAGIDVGRVRSVQRPARLADLLTGQEYFQSRVLLVIEDQFRNAIPAHAQIRVMRRGLGSSYIAIDVDADKPLVPVDPERPETAFMFDGMLVQGSVGAVSEFLPEAVQKQLDQLVTNLTLLVGNVNDVIGNAENKENIRVTLSHLSEATAQATRTLAQLERLGVAGEQTAQDMDAAVNMLGDSLVETSVELTAALTEMRIMLQRINAGEGTAGRMLTDASLFESMLDSAAEIEELMAELRIFVTRMREDGLPIRLF